MTLLAVAITELIASDQPSIVRCRVIDTSGRAHEIIEKLPIVSVSDVLPVDDASLACRVTGVRLDGQGRRVVTVDIACPWGCETVEGLTSLEIFEHQLASSDEPWVAIGGALVPAAIVGTNDGLNYGRFFGQEAVEYQAVLPIACLDWYAQEFAALVDEMREDDLLDDQPSPFAEIGYRRTLAEAAEYPLALAEAVETFCDRALLGRYFSFDEVRSKWVINSTDAVWVVAGQIVIVGRCWRWAGDAARS